MTAAHGPVLDGFGIGQFRSFEGPVQRFRLSTQVTLLAGQNNAGKSNVLRFLQTLARPTPQAPNGDLDRPLSIEPAKWTPLLSVAVPRHTIDERFDAANLRNDMYAAKAIDDMLDFLAHDQSKDVVWLDYALPVGAGANNPLLWQSDSSAVPDRVLPEPGLLRAIANRLSNQEVISGGSQRADFHRMLERLAPPLQAILPDVHTVDAFRQIRANDGSRSVDTYDGFGLIDRLAMLQNPNLANRQEREKFDRITAFLRFILDEDTASLSIPYDSSVILVERHGNLLPLASLGTGIHQVIILAAAATVLDRQLIAIEEPEVHLHPVLQRRLVQYLRSSTTNQYVIATHSAHLLDYERATVFHVTNNSDSGTKIDSVAKPGEVARLFADLGYRPSDLLQTNAVIWVEGPSDRLYLRRWIELLMDGDAPIEGIDYSIMFYGGGLLRHLSPSDPDSHTLAGEEHERHLRDFISLRRINRHLVVLIDSDKRSRNSKINATKQRVKDAFSADDGPGFAWITQGYTVENYIPHSKLQAAVDVVHKSRKVRSGDLYTNPLPAEGTFQFDKVSIASSASALLERSDMSSHLVSKVREVIGLINDANGRSAATQKDVQES